MAWTTCAAGWPGEVPEGPWLYPEDQIADLPMRMIAAEITREKLTLRLHQELPYQLTVETENWEERADGSARIDQVIYVAATATRASCWAKGRDDQGGRAGRAGRDRGVPGPPVHLFLQVKVRPGWLERPSAIPRWASTSATGTAEVARADSPTSGCRPTWRG
jgi:GTPase